MCLSRISEMFSPCPIPEQKKIDQCGLGSRMAAIFKKVINSALFQAIFTTASLVTCAVILNSCQPHLLFYIPEIVLGVSLTIVFPFIYYRGRQIINELAEVSTLLRGNSKNYQHLTDDSNNCHPLFDLSQRVLGSIAHISRRVLQSPLVWTLIGLSGVITSGVMINKIQPFSYFSLPAATLGATTFATIPYAYSRGKEILYEASLLKTIFFNTLSQNRFPWYNEIIPGKLILGAIPLKNYDHIDILVKQEGVKSVLSLVEQFEFKDSLFSEPVSETDWSAAGVAQYLIQTPDFKPLSLNDIHDSVEYLRNQISKNRKVYVHCKAGKGRSATIVACYLLKYGNSKHNLAINSSERAIAHLKSLRKINLNAKQEQAVVNYSRHLRS